MSNEVRLNRDEAEEYTRSMAQAVAGDYGLMDFAINVLGVPRALGYVNEDGSVDADAWVQERIGGYIKRSIEQRRQAVKALADDGRTNAQIGAALGVSEYTVSDDRAMLDAQGANVRTPSALESSESAGQSVSGGTNVRTPAERKALVKELWERGKSNVEIAVALGGTATPSSVRRDVSNLKGEKAARPLAEILADPAVQAAVAEQVAQARADEAERVRAQAHAEADRALLQARTEAEKQARERERLYQAEVAAIRDAEAAEVRINEEVVRLNAEHANQEEALAVLRKRVRTLVDPEKVKEVEAEVKKQERLLGLQKTRAALAESQLHEAQRKLKALEQEAPARLERINDRARYDTIMKNLEKAMGVLAGLNDWLSKTPGELSMADEKQHTIDFCGHIAMQLSSIEIKLGKEVDWSMR